MQSLNWNNALEATNFPDIFTSSWSTNDFTACQKMLNDEYILVGQGKATIVLSCHCLVRQKTLPDLN